jgi:hypothetical protein
MPNVFNMAYGVKPPVLNPESVSRYDGLYEVVRFHAADRHTPEENKPRRFVRTAGFS